MVYQVATYRKIRSKPQLNSLLKEGKLEGFAGVVCNSKCHF